MTTEDLLTKDTLRDYADINYRGYSSSEVFLLTKIEAIKNAVKMYLMSQTGDYGRDVLSGGPLFPLLGKLATSEGEIRTTITEALKIYSNIIVTDVSAFFQTDIKTWKIKVSFRDTINKVQTSVDLGIQQ